MNICAKYSFNNGFEVLKEKYSPLLTQIEEIVRDVIASKCKKKNTSEQILYSPHEFNKSFKDKFYSNNWTCVRVPCEYSTEFYTKEYSPTPLNQGAFREMDFVKERLGVEVQFGKYASMAYSGCAKMTIFHNIDIIDLGVEIVPSKNFADEMSTGVSYFEQFVWDLQTRGVSNIDIPVFVLGIDK